MTANSLLEQLRKKMKAMEAATQKQSLVLDYGRCRGYAQTLRDDGFLTEKAFNALLSELAELYRQVNGTFTHG